MEPVDRRSNESYNFQGEGITEVKSMSNCILAFSDVRLTTENFTNTDKQVTSIVLNKCISDDWAAVLNEVANLKQIKELSITHCELRDKHMQSLTQMAHLQKLVLGTILLTEMVIN
jgi:hypothetical protein